MKTYSGIWESGGTLFENQPGADLLKLIPQGFKPSGTRSRRKELKGIPHDIFEGPFGRKLIVTEDLNEEKPHSSSQ